MATKRFRAGRWYYQVKHKLLQKPLYVSFAKEDDGDDYIRQLESVLAAGIVPPQVAQRTVATDFKNVDDVVAAYELKLLIPESDALVLKTVRQAVGKAAVPITIEWVEAWIDRMKAERLSPSTIRHRVGALARAFDWLVRTRPHVQAENPIRRLPKRYATYRDEAVVEQERDRRLHEGEEEAIRRVLAGWKPPGRERGVTADPDLVLVFELALETAMRLREIFTLTPDQVDLGKRTIYLDRTKNGDSRQVPLSSVAVRVLQGFKGFSWLRDGSRRDLRRVTSLLSRRFSTVFELAGCPDLHEHDLRHEATCRIYERTTLSDVQIARITGHKDLRTLRRYASLRGSDLATAMW